MKINTNIASLNAQAQSTMTNNNISNSLEKLSSGLKINKAADDASGMAIADKLRMQASVVGQGIANANSGSALITIADKAMGEQSKILDTVKTKLLQAATSTTSAEGREAIRKDIQKLLNQIDDISTQTTYNGVNLLNEKGADFNFQVGEKREDVIGMTTAYAVNTAGLGSSGSDGSTTAALKATNAGGIILEGEQSDTHIAVKTTGGSVTLTANDTTASAEISFMVSANNVSGFTISETNSGTDEQVMLSTTNEDLKAFLNNEAAKSTADALTKVGDGQWVLKTTAAGDPSSYSFSNGQVFDISDLKVSGLNSVTDGNAGEAFTIRTSEAVDIQKLGGAADVVLTAAEMDLKTYGDSLEGIDFSGNTYVTNQEGTVAIKASNSTTNSNILVNSTLATTQADTANLDLNVESDSVVSSISMLNTGGGASVILTTTDAGTAEALKSAGLTQEDNGSFKWETTLTNTTQTLSFSEAVQLKNLNISGVDKTTAGNDRLYFETDSSITVQNNKTGGATENHNVSLSVATTAGAGAATGFTASEVTSGLAHANLQGILALGEDDLTADVAKSFMSVIDDAMTQLNTVRSDFGSTQNQIRVAVDNMMTTQVNLKAAESTIRDVDYAAESANFNKQNIIAQAGTYAMSQANQVQQNVLRLLQ